MWFWGLDLSHPAEEALHDWPSPDEPRSPNARASRASRLRGPRSSSPQSQARSVAVTRFPRELVHVEPDGVPRSPDAGRRHPQPVPRARAALASFSDAPPGRGNLRSREADSCLLNDRLRFWIGHVLEPEPVGLMDDDYAVRAVLNPAREPGVIRVEVRDDDSGDSGQTADGRIQFRGS